MTDERYADEELSKARRALNDAEQLVQTSGSEEGIVNRLYYASFHAAQAALYVRGVDPARTEQSGIASARKSFSTATGRANRVDYLLRSPIPGNERITGTTGSALTSMCSPSGPERSSKR